MEPGGAISGKPVTSSNRGVWTSAAQLLSSALRPLALLDLKENPCGIVDLVRALEEDDRSTILNILEEATATSSSFCFSAIVHGPKGRASHLFCIGIRRSATRALKAPCRAPSPFLVSTDESRLKQSNAIVSRPLSMSLA